MQLTLYSLPLMANVAFMRELTRDISVFWLSSSFFSRTPRPFWLSLINFNSLQSLTTADISISLSAALVSRIILFNYRNRQWYAFQESNNMAFTLVVSFQFRIAGEWTSGNFADKLHHQGHRQYLWNHVTVYACVGRLIFGGNWCSYAYAIA